MKIPLAITLAFLIIASMMYIVQSAEKITGHAVIDPLSVERNLTVVIIPELAAWNIISPYDEEEAKLAITLLQKAFDRLGFQKLPTTFVEDSLIEAEKAYAGKNVTGIIAEIMRIKDKKQREQTLLTLNLTPNMTKINYNYTKAVEVSHTALQHAQNLFSLQERIVLLNITLAGINRTEYNMTELDVQFENLAGQFFKEQNIAELGEQVTQSYKRMEELMLEQSRLSALLKASRRTLQNFIITNWRSLLVVLVLLIITGIIASNELGIHNLDAKLKDLEVELKTLEILLKKTQAERYVEKKLSVTEYKTKFEQYKTRITTIQHTMPVVAAKKEKLMKRRKYYWPFSRVPLRQ